MRRSMWIITIALIVPLLIAAVATAAAPPVHLPIIIGGRATSTPTTAPRTIPTTAPATTVQEQMLQLVNAERAKVGCQPLRINAQITDAAQKHTEWMAETGDLNHTGADGSNAGERMTTAGYKWSTWGENIAMGYRSAASVMEAWMTSEGHRSNILKCDFKEIGIGYALTTGGTPYWTQDFGSPR